MKFAYCNPVRVFFGADELKRTGANAVDLVIGVGGGSAMDAAKTAAADVPPRRALPTSPAASSEMNCGAVL